MPKGLVSSVVRVLDRVAKSEPEETVSAGEVLAELFPGEQRPSVVLRGLRAKEDLTQSDLARKLGITQPDVANMECGRRAISKEMAKKLAKIFKTDHRIFL